MNTRSKMASCSNRETSAANAAVNVDYHQFFKFPELTQIQCYFGQIET